MMNENILENNLYKGCSKEELTILWGGLKRYYSEGFFAEDNPIILYKNKYCEENSFDIIQIEQELLRAIAVQFVDTIKTNKALTLEELKKMRNKPVWIVNQNGGHWEIATGALWWNSDKNSEYGKTWIAYEYE